MLEAVGGNKTLAAQILGLDRKTLYRKLERYGATGDKPSQTATERSDRIERAGTERPERNDRSDAE